MNGNRIPLSRAAQLGVLLAVTFFAYGNSLFNSFTMDDELYIFRNPQVTHPSLHNIFHANAASNVYRPLTFATLAANFAVSGDHPFAYHLINLLLHAAVVVALFFLLEKLLEGIAGAEAIAFSASLLFAVHPIHTEAVTSIIGRSELLAAGLLLLAWLLHLRDRPIFSALCFVLALLSKESAIVFLPMALAADFARRNWKPWIRYVAFGLVTAGYLGLLWNLQGGHFGTASVSWLDNPLDRLPPLWRALNALRISWKYAGLLAYPAALSCDYSYNEITLYGDLRHTLPAAFASFAVAAAWIWSCCRRSVALAAAGALYLVGFTVTSNVFVRTGTILGERLAYLPSAGFCLLIGCLLRWSFQKYARPAMALLAILVVALGLRTTLRNRDWRDNFSLYTSAVAAVPGSAKMHAYLGGEYLNRRQLDPARREFEIALVIYPDFPDAIESLGLLESWAGNHGKAIDLMEKALQLSDRSNINYDYMAVNLAATLLQSGRSSEALIVLDRDIAESPGYSRAWSNRAVLHLQRNEFDLAKSDAESALRLDPNSSQARGVLQKLRSSSSLPPGSGN
jgi:tetratricopeptide (TPR) repeat protein